MNKKKRPEIDTENMGKNPFMANAVIKARAWDKETFILIKTEEGINIPTGKVNNSLLVEEQTFTKVYHDVDFRDRLLLLDEYSLKLATFIIYQLNPNEDFIWINSSLFMSKTKLRDSRIYELAVQSLIRYDIITPTMYKDTYWINPLIFFSGNRLKKYTNNVKVR